jgi:hypothetical protein
MNVSDRDFDPGRDRGPSASFDPSHPGAGSTGTTGSTGAERSTSPGDGGDSRGVGDAARAAGLPHADDIVGELMPEEVDWEHLVRSYPVPALALAAAAGFWLGATRGPTVLSAVTGWAAGEMTRRVNDLVGQDLL